MSKSEIIKIEGQFERETEKAYGVICEGQLHWFPKSQVNVEMHAKKEDGSQRCTVNSPEWLLEKKGL